MIKRSINAPDTEPEQKHFDLPSEKEHLLAVSDIFTKDDEIGQKLNLNDDTVSVKCEVSGGSEEGRTLLIRLSLDPEWKGFFATRLFLKAIGFPHKGQIEIDTDEFQGKQFYATVIHKDGYANVKEYNFEKMVEDRPTGVDGGEDEDTKKEEEIEWDE